MFSRPIRTGLVTAIAIGVAVLNWSMLAEAYGSGPPYYSQTTNMDKWTSPWTLLGPVDVLSALIVFALFRRGKRG